MSSKQINYRISAEDAPFLAAIRRVDAALIEAECNVIDMILIRPTQINGAQYATGARVSVEVGMAVQLLQTTRARLVDPADLALVVEGVEPCRRPIVGRFVTNR